jgi:hypothetical protein
LTDAILKLDEPSKKDREKDPDGLENPPNRSEGSLNGAESFPNDTENSPDSIKKASKMPETAFLAI